MQIEELDSRWRELTEEVATGMKEWRLQHPRATFREIEAALGERLARMLENATLMSRAVELEAEGEGERLTCPDCDTPLQARGQQSRDLVT